MEKKLQNFNFYKNEFLFLKEIYIGLYFLEYINSLSI